MQGLAELLFARGRLSEAQRRFEQAAELAQISDRRRLLRLAAGAATARFVGNDALELLRRAADVALADGDPGGACRDLAEMATLIGRTPGIMAHVPNTGRRRAPCSTGPRTCPTAPTPPARRSSPRRASLPTTQVPPRPPDARLAVQLAERTADPLLLSAALDLATGVHLAGGDIGNATADLRRRQALLDDIPLGPALGVRDQLTCT